MKSMKHPEYILSLKNLLFGYDYHSPVIDGVTLDVPKGGFIGLLGPSGSGKSTLLKLIVGIHKPWEGEILFSKVDNGKNRKFPIIGYSPQVEGIDWDFPVTVRELVSMGVWNRSGFFPWINKPSRIEIDIILDDLGIGGYSDHQIKELSGGEQKRVFLARALIHNPEIIILDEPTAGLDNINKNKFLQILGDLNSRGITIILTTHDIDSVAKKLPWIVCLNKSIISQGPPDLTLCENILYKTYDLK
ncbi:MAG TPA: metal ABC transporter ATP-binding protein [Nitrososphaeraceae archaeon]|jgi:ABC-type Mn2+/Zn2+ transport system ATPase subunit|nr:metal ABC transporter ATP-binding protein [Nitrososphaeraceae archaeon]